jgi:tetratricopeptide (TPR) repeat protein
MSQRWFIGSGLITLLLSGCGMAKSAQDIAKLTKASTILITAYTEQPSTGTGFFIEGEKGVCTVLTARHVVPIATKVSLQTNDGKRPRKPAKIQRFPNQDLAIVTFKPVEEEDCPYPALKLGDSDKVAEGETIHIAGFPGGSPTSQFVPGTVSALAKRPDGYGISYSATTAGGMSGGPVVNSAGEVIAIHGITEQQLIEKEKLKGENPSPQQQSAKSTNPPERVVQDTFKWGIPSKVYKENLAAAKSEVDMAKELLNKGNDLVASKKYEEAIAAYNKALVYKPNYAEVWFGGGVMLYELKRYEDAIASYDKALKIKPNYHKAWYNRGVTLDELKRYEEAIVSYDKATQFKPNYHKAWYSRGIALGELKRYEEAIASYDKALKFKPDFHEAWYNRGNVLGKLKRYEEAIASYDKALKFKPDFHEAWYNRGNVLGKLKRYEEAIASYDKALKFKPDFHEAWNGKGIALGELKRYEEAIASFEKAIQIKPDFPEAWNNRGIPLGELKRYEEAIASYDKALQIKPDFHEAWNGKGVALEQLQKYDEALKCYDKAISIQPDFQFAINNRKELLTKLGRSE